jgi:carboxypeptidase Taq
MASDDSKRKPDARRSAGTGAVPSFLSFFAHKDEYEDPAPVVDGEPVDDGDIKIERGPNLDAQQAEGSQAGSGESKAPAQPVGAADAVERMYQQEVASAGSAPAANAPAQAKAAPAPQPSDGHEAIGKPRRPAPAAISNPKEDIAALDDLERHLYAHRYARIGISCYGPSIDPAKAVSDRGEAQAILEQEDKELLCNPETGALLDRLKAMPDLLDDTRKAQVKVLSRDREQMVGIPDDLQMEHTRLLAQASSVWHRAKAENDFASFEPYLDRLVASAKEIARHQNPKADPYDVWLDRFEHGCDRKFYDELFGQVKGIVVPLYAEIRRIGWQPDRSVIEGRFDERRQWALASDLVDLEGLDRDALFVTSTEHPFSDALTTNYAIIAAHVYENDVVSNVFTMLHEGGHTLYECGVNPAYNYTSLKGGTSAGMHEAQSRFFENYVGRSRAFAGPLLKAMASHFRGQLGRVTPNQLYLAVNRAEGGLIRTEADELTYPLHVLVRYEIEQMLFSGQITAKDVPTVWGEKYQEYLGVTVPDDTHGCLQDSHWSDGLFGYFPTYALGSAIGAQLRHQMISEGMDWEGLLSQGNLAPVREWLRTRIWQYGRAKDSSELIQDACGKPFDASYYTDYLLQKFSAIYGIRLPEAEPEDGAQQ